MAARELAEAILFAALAVAKKGCPVARTWLLDDRDGFLFWCSVLGQPAERVREYCRRELAEEKAPAAAPDG